MLLENKETVQRKKSINDEQKNMKGKAGNMASKHQREVRRTQHL